MANNLPGLLNAALCTGHRADAFFLPQKSVPTQTADIVVCLVSDAAVCDNAVKLSVWSSLAGRLAGGGAESGFGVLVVRARGNVSDFC